eukprot:contig_29950_g7337
MAGTRIFVGNLSRHVRTRELEDMFRRYGRVVDVDIKTDFAFVEMSDPRDADEAVYQLHGRRVDGDRMTVEFARSAGRRGMDGPPPMGGGMMGGFRGPPP